MNADPDKYRYSGCDIGIDSRSEFLFSDGSYGKNFIVFRTDMSSSFRVDKKEKISKFLVEGQQKD